MRLASSRVAAALVLALSLLVGGFSFDSSVRADSQQKEKEKPKMQKPSQQAPPEPDQDDKDPVKIGTDLVTLDVTVLDPSSKPVLDLKEENFQVFEDKVQQQISFFSREQVPVSVVF